MPPLADGGTEQWTNHAGTACASATCYTEVDENPASGCLGQDSTYNKSTTTGNQVQTYDLDESTIPDNSTVTSMEVHGCVVRGGSQNANFRFKVSINGTVTNCATASTSTSTLTYFTCSIDHADDVKGASDDYEIGVENTQARAVNLESIEVVVTYTPPATRNRAVLVQ